MTESKGPIVSPPGAQRRSLWSGQSRWTVLGSFMSVAATVVALVVTGYGLLESTGNGRRTPGGTATVTASPTAPGTGTPSDTQPSFLPGATVGLVNYSEAAGTPEAVDIARMFDGYFSAINAKDANRAISYFDPAGVVDPNDPNARSRLAQAIATTTDSDIALRAVSRDTTNEQGWTARVTFRSNQQPGYGPRGREAETCTLWDAIYRLSYSDQTYRILQSTATNSPC